MEQQLKEYRARKRNENASNTFLRRFWHKSEVQGNKASESASSPIALKESSESKYAESPLEDSGSKSSSTRSTSDTDLIPAAIEVPHDWKHYLPIFLQITLWFLLWMFFIEIGFGAVFFAVSGCYLMYRNTRTGPRDRKQLSAYSVFNKNQERLDGTFTAEQFERELRFGAGSVR